MTRVALLLALAACSLSGPRPARATPTASTESTNAVRAGVAITVDDLPWVGPLPRDATQATLVRRIVAALAAHRAPATGFVVCERLSRSDGRAALQAWTAGGLDVGNHTSTHRHLDAIPIDEWEKDVRSCQEQLRHETGRAPIRFRFPFLGTGRSAEARGAAREVLARLHVRDAPVSIDTGEWTLAAPYVDALNRSDAARAKEIGDAWVTHVLAAVRHYRALGLSTEGREIAHVLLLHANALAADHLDRLLTALEADGLAFVALSDALADPVYAKNDDYVGAVGLSWLYRLSPATADAAWAWDDGQLQALRRRFGQAADDQPLRLDRDLSLRPVAPHTWVVTHEVPYPANELLAELDDGTLLIASSPYTNEATARLVVWLTTRFGPRKLVVVDTHSHDDAAGGNAAFRAAGAEVWGADLTRDRLRATLTDASTGRVDEAGLPDHVFPLAAGKTLRFGADEVQVRFPGPAHAPDNVVVYLPGRRVLFGGCAVIARDVVGNTADADLERWPDALRVLQELPADVIIPGHGDRVDAGLLKHGLEVLAAHGARP